MGRRQRGLIPCELQPDLKCQYRPLLGRTRSRIGSKSDSTHRQADITRRAAQTEQQAGTNKTKPAVQELLSVLSYISTHNFDLKYGQLNVTKKRLFSLWFHGLLASHRPLCVRIFILYHQNELSLPHGFLTPQSIVIKLPINRHIKIRFPQQSSLSLSVHLQCKSSS